MASILPSDAMDMIRALSLENSKEESCGFLLKDGSVIQSANVHSDKTNNFRVSETTVSFFDPEGIAAVWHSHIKPSQGSRLSLADIQASRMGRVPYLCYHTVFDEWDYFDPDGVHPDPLKAKVSDSPLNLSYYMGWPFEWSRSDCYSVVRSVFKGILGVNLGDYMRPLEEETVKADSWDEFGRHFGSEGFRGFRPDEEEIKPFDIAMIAMHGAKAHHMMLMIDPSKNIAFHLCHGGISTDLIYGGSWQRRTRYFIRHSSRE